MANNNVVVFPKGKNNAPPQSLDEIVTQLRENKAYFSDELAQDLINFIVNEVFNAGYDLDETDQGVGASMQLVYEALKATINRLDGIHHPLQDIADDLYLPAEDDGEIVVDNSEDMG